MDNNITSPAATSAFGESLVSPAHAARLVPGTCNPSTVVRWITRGVRDPNLQASRIKLKARRIGGRWKVSIADLGVFLDLLNSQAGPTISAAIEARDARDWFVSRFGM